MRYSSSLIILLSAFLIMISFTMIPLGANAEENLATVRIEYEGPYWGTIKGYEEITIETQGTRDYDVTGDIIYVILTKGDESSNEMKVSIIVNGAARVSDSTSEPFGEVRISFTFGNLNDEDGQENWSCFGIMIAPLILLSSGVLVLSGRRK